MKWRSKLKDEVAKAAIALRIARLAAGHSGDARPVGGGLSELRINYGPGYRIYYCQRGDTIIVLLCGGDKDTQMKDVKTAKALAKEWIK